MNLITLNAENHGLSIYEAMVFMFRDSHLLGFGPIERVHFMLATAFPGRVIPDRISIKASVVVAERKDADLYPPPSIALLYSCAFCVRSNHYAACPFIAASYELVPSNPSARASCLPRTV